ncbi:MAG: argininosuccinate lyase [Usitatibacter sp.]
MTTRSKMTAAALLAALPVLAWSQGPANKPAHDNFYWLGEFNKASTVMVVEQGIVPRDLGAKIAAGVAHVIEDGDKPGAKRPGDYLQYEPLLVAYSGPDATRMHSGRSRQDILSTTRRVMLRERVLSLLQAMAIAREKMLATAAEHVQTIVPAYTNGVQAQPTTFAHYLLGFAAAFDRDAERLRQAYARLNLSPLGSAALGTSSFPVNRPRLAELLGFDGVAENSYDANQLATLDVAGELADIAALAALTTGSLVQDIHTQYHQTEPWLLIHTGSLTHTSSIMPQKRNPTILNTLRLQASTVVGEAATYTFQSHNVTPGMPDYKREESQKTLDDATEMFRELAALFDNLVVFRERALAEVNAEYSTTTELADVLQREADVPFRVGHHFASELVDFGRKNKLKPADIAYADAVRIYAEAGKKFALQDTKLPLTEARFRSSLSPEGMVNSSQGLGGPQPAEVKRMLEGGRKRLADDVAWAKDRQAKLDDARARLDATFRKLL